MTLSGRLSARMATPVSVSLALERKAGHPCGFMHGIQLETSEGIGRVDPRRSVAGLNEHENYCPIEDSCCLSVD